MSSRQMGVLPILNLIRLFFFTAGHLILGLFYNFSMHLNLKLNPNTTDLYMDTCMKHFIELIFSVASKHKPFWIVFLQLSFVVSSRACLFMFR